MRQTMPMMMVFFCPMRSMRAPLKKVTAMPARETLVIMEEITVLDTAKSSLKMGMKIPLVFSMNGDRNISVKMRTTPNLLLLLFCMAYIFSPLFRIASDFCQLYIHYYKPLRYNIIEASGKIIFPGCQVSRIRCTAELSEKPWQ